MLLAVMTAAMLATNLLDIAWAAYIALSALVILLIVRILGVPRLGGGD